MCLFHLYYSDIKEPHYSTCGKCNTTFKLYWGGKSQYRSCRARHRLDINGFCNDCHSLDPSSSYCFHTRKRSWWEC